MNSTFREQNDLNADLDVNNDLDSNIEENENLTATNEDINMIAEFFDPEEFGVTPEPSVPTPSGDIQPSDDKPKMDNVANAGVSSKYSRGDHVHPSDTRKVFIFDTMTNVEIDEIMRS